MSSDEVGRLTGDGTVNQDVSRMVGVVCGWMTKVLEEYTYVGTVDGENNIDQSNRGKSYKHVCYGAIYKCIMYM